MAIVIPVQEPTGHPPVRINPAVTKKRPVAPDFLNLAQVNFGQDNFFFLNRRFGQDNAKGVTDERTPPEFEAVPAIGGWFVAYPIHGGHEHAIRNRMTAVHGVPGTALRLAFPFFF